MIVIELRHGAVSKEGTPYFLICLQALTFWRTLVTRAIPDIGTVAVAATIWPEYFARCGSQVGGSLPAYAARRDCMFSLIVFRHSVIASYLACYFAHLPTGIPIPRKHAVAR